MATIASRTSRRPLTERLVGVRIPIWFAVVCSRLIVVASGAAGALFTSRVGGWERIDPDRVSTSLGSVGNVLAASMVRWDALGYLGLAHNGYSKPGSLVLFPLYPVLIHLVAVPVRSAVVAGVLISVVTFAIGLALIHRIASEEIGRRTADTTVLLLAFAPFSFVFTAVYTESLLLACLAGSFYLARRDRFVWASVAASAAALTHIEGVLMVAPLAFMYWKSRGRPRELRRLWSPSMLALALPPLTLAGFFVYLHARGWGWLAPVTSQNVSNAGRTLVGPPIVVLESIQDVVAGLNRTVHGMPPAGGLFAPGVQNIIYLGVLVIAILALINAWKRLPKEYALFAGLVMLVCTSSAVAQEPLKGFDRYLLPIFPLWIGAATWLEQRKLTSAILRISTVLLVFYTVEFARWVSVF
jgi:hypothetical protein